VRLRGSAPGASEDETVVARQILPSLLVDRPLSDSDPLCQFASLGGAVQIAFRALVA